MLTFAAIISQFLTPRPVGLTVVWCRPAMPSWMESQAMMDFGLLSLPHLSVGEWLCWTWGASSGSGDGLEPGGPGVSALF